MSENIDGRHANSSYSQTNPPRPEDHAEESPTTENVTEQTKNGENSLADGDGVNSQTYSPTANSHIEVNDPPATRTEETQGDHGANLHFGNGSNSANLHPEVELPTTARSEVSRTIEVGIVPNNPPSTSGSTRRAAYNEQVLIIHNGEA